MEGLNTKKYPDSACRLKVLTGSKVAAAPLEAEETCDILGSVQEYLPTSPIYDWRRRRKKVARLFDARRREEPYRPYSRGHEPA